MFFNKDFSQHKFMLANCHSTGFLEFIAKHFNAAVIKNFNIL